MILTDLRIFVVCYANGNFHSSTTDMDIAYSTADRIGGILGELTNVHRPLKEKDIPEPLRSQLIYAIEHPESRVRRTVAIDDDHSTGALDQPEAA